MDRRSFIESLIIVGVASRGNPILFRDAELDVSANSIPRWRGFNLQGRFAMPGKPYDGRAFDEFDFATMHEWGFDFARLPLSYLIWGSRDDWSVIREAPLKEIDRAVDLGRQYGIHINLNVHRIPASMPASLSQPICSAEGKPNATKRYRPQSSTGRRSPAAIGGFPTGGSVLT